MLTNVVQTVEAKPTLLAPQKIMFSYLLQDDTEQKEDAGHILGKVAASRIRFLEVKSTSH